MALQRGVSLPEMSQEGVPRGKQVVEFLLVFLCFTAIYGLTLSRNLGTTVDSIQYINGIDHAVNLFHPHHLLYSAMGYVWLHGCRALGIHTDSALVVEFLSGLFGALTLGVIYLTLRNRLRLSPLPAVLGVALAGFSFGFWYYSDCVEENLPALFFLALAFYLLTKDRLRARDFALIGVVHGGAIMFHQVNVLFVPAVLAAMVRTSRHGEQSLVKCLGAYTAMVIPAVAIPYLLVMRQVYHFSSLGAAAFWFTQYAHHTNYWYPISPKTPINIAIGYGHTLIGGHFLFALPAIRSLLMHSLSGHTLQGEVYVTRGLSANNALALVAALLGFFVLIISSLAVRWKDWRATWRQQHTFLIILLCWLVPYVLFFSVWEPNNLAFWIPQSACVWIGLLALWSVVPASSRGNWLLAGAVALLIVVNYFGSIAYLRTPRHDFYRAAIAPIVSTARPGDLVILDNAWMTAGYLQRFTSVRAISLNIVAGEARSPIAARLRVEGAIDGAVARGHRVFISQDAAALSLPTAEDRRQLGLLWGKYQPHWKTVPGEVKSYYLVE